VARGGGSAWGVGGRGEAVGGQRWGWGLVGGVAGLGGVGGGGSVGFGGARGLGMKH